MKQGNASTPTLDLDDLERQLKAATAPRRSVADDPLAELARIVGQDDPLGRPASRQVVQDVVAPPSFDDFLKIPPRPIAGGMPAQTPAVEPLFPEKAADAVADAGESEDVESEGVVTESAKPDFVAAFNELELRDALPAGFAEVSAPAVEAVNPSVSLDELEARLAAAVNDDMSSVQRSADLPSVHIPALEPASAAPSGVDKSAEPKSGFDDMLAEFEAAMRDVGAEKNVAQAAPTLEPIIVPPPPTGYQTPEIAAPAEPSAGLSAGLGGAAAAGAAVVPAGAAAAASGRPRRGLMLAGGVIGVALIGIAGLMAFGGPKTSVPGNAPVIAAKPGVTKERPANPGGVEVPNQDKEVLSSAAANRAEQPARIAPREEQPVDLTQAQRSAEAQNSGVRQIPGVLVIPPVSAPSASAPVSAPAATPSAAAPQPTPRPVASVPITVNGQPAAAPTPPPLAAAPVAAAPGAPRVAAAPPPAAPTPPSAAPAAPSPAPQAAAPAEPRRVRTVPIRPDEGAPQRAQTQPRVVPANPRPASVAPAPEAEVANAPLRITPAANRGPQQAAAAPSGLVPSSTNSNSNNQSATTQSASAPRAQASSGSGFAIQLAAEGSEDAARTRFNRMRSQHSDVLGGMNPNIRSAEVNGRAVYRVRVGNMSREEAVGVCEKLKADGGSCFVARN